MSAMKAIVCPLEYGSVKWREGAGSILYEGAAVRMTLYTGAGTAAPAGGKIALTTSCKSIKSERWGKKLAMALM